MARPSDVKAVAKIFDQEHESAEAAATAAIEALDLARRDRLTYGVAVQGLPVAYLYYGFENREEAIRWSKRVALDVAGLSVGVIPVYNKDVVLDRHRVMTENLEEANKPAPVTKRRKRKAA